MRNYTDYIPEIGRELEFPEEGTQALWEAWKKLEKQAKDGDVKTAEAAAAFLAWIDKYDREERMDYAAALKAAEDAGKAADVHPYTAQLLLFLCMTAHLKELYEKRGISQKIWRDSCKDLKWKLLECRRMYGIWGSFVAGWFPGFFDLTRFALGRLQFELTDFPEGYEKAGRTRPEGIVFYGLRGTPFDLPAPGTILLIEDVGERPYHVERMLYDLRLGGILPRLSGILVGQFTEYTEDRAIGSTLYEMILRMVRPYGYPVAFGFPVGHTPDNTSLPLGRRYRLCVEPDSVRLVSQP